LAAAEEYNDNLHEEVHLLNNHLNPLLPHDNNDDEEMGSGVIMAKDDDDLEIDGLEDVPPEEEEEDEELEPASDEEEGRSSTLTRRMILSLAYCIATVLVLSFVAFHVWESGL
jgi:hypothetical protein